MWDIFRDPEIQRIEQRRSGGGLPFADDDPEGLAEQVDRLTLVTEALWQLVAERSGLHDGDLARVIVELDRQGSGAVGPNDEQVQRRCADCDAVIPPNADRCQFCGGEPLAPGQPRKMREPEPSEAPAAAPPPPAAAPPPPPPPPPPG